VEPVDNTRVTVALASSVRLPFPLSLTGDPEFYALPFPISSIIFFIIMVLVFFLGAMIGGGSGGGALSMNPGPSVGATASIYRIVLGLLVIPGSVGGYSLYKAFIAWRPFLGAAYATRSSTSLV
jgi:hypothetical protein